jgi:hypothetical protein
MEYKLVDLNELSALLGRSQVDIDSWLASHVEARTGSSK